MKIGFNMLLWTSHITEEDFSILDKLKKVGYDGIEVPVFEGDTSHFEKIGKVLKDNGLAASTATIIPDEAHNPISAGPCSCNTGMARVFPQQGRSLYRGPEIHKAAMGRSCIKLWQAA